MSYWNSKFYIRAYAIRATVVANYSFISINVCLFCFPRFHSKIACFGIYFQVYGDTEYGNIIMLIVQMAVAVVYKFGFMWLIGSV